MFRVKKQTKILKLNKCLKYEKFKLL